MRIVLGIQYNGSKYHGWQSQPGMPTIQAQLEQALSKVADHNIALTCAGRTDSGVHATGQVVHFDTYSKRDAQAWIMGTNSQLAKNIRVLWAKSVDCSFHARYSAMQRRYLYLIYNRSVSSALLADQITWHPYSLDQEKMKFACEIFLGEHDFSSFRASSCKAQSPIRRINHIDIRSNGELIVIDVAANAFLQHMVRNIVGVLLAVGRGKLRVQEVITLLTEKNRQLGEVTAPPQGLYLIYAQYPNRFRLNNRPLPPLNIKLNTNYHKRSTAKIAPN